MDQGNRKRNGIFKPTTHIIIVRLVWPLQLTNHRSRHKCYLHSLGIIHRDLKVRQRITVVYLMVARLFFVQWCIDG
jgi:serine/threonine protein kinase